MDEAVGAITKYIDFFVLGAIAFLAISAPFKPFQPLRKGWEFLLYRCLPEAILKREDRAQLPEQASAAKDNAAEARPSDKTIHIIQVCLAGAFLFALFYFAGIAVNGFGHSRLDGAHMLVVKESQALVANGQGETSAPFALYLRPLPLFNSAKPDEQAAYVADAKAQLRWSICDPTSYESMNGGATIKHLRLVRGAIGIVFLVFVASVVALILVWLRVRPKQHAENPEPESKIRGDQLVWAWSCLAGSLIVYGGMLIPMYWNIEMNTHTTVAAVFPPISKADYALECRRKDFEFAIREKGKYPFVGEEKEKEGKDKDDKKKEGKETEAKAKKPKGG